MNLMVLTLAMGAVTYIPRMLPMVLLQNLQLPAYLRRFFRFIPFAALGALIFPSVLASTGGQNLLPAVAGSIISVLLSLKGANLMLVVLGGILGAFLGTVAL